MKPPRVMKELLLALTLIAIGLFALPAMIYVVGQRTIGDYEGGMWAYYQAIADALAIGNPFAWLLVLSPYLGIQIMRFGFWVRRQRRAVT